MAWEPSLGAFYGPASFITFVNCMYFLSIFIQLRRHPERKYELKEPTEEQQRLAANEHGEVNHQDSMSLSLISTSALENEHTFHSQLLGASLTLLLYVTLWMFGALAVSLYYPLDLVFSFFFGATCLSLSAFIMVHHCVNREDVRLAWIDLPKFFLSYYQKSFHTLHMFSPNCPRSQTPSSSPANNAQYPLEDEAVKRLPSWAPSWLLVFMAPILALVQCPASPVVNLYQKPGV